MKKFNSDNKYLGWGLTAFCVIAGAIVFYMLLQHGGVVVDGINAPVSYTHLTLPTICSV